MYIVTKISQQKKLANRYNVFLNDTYAFSINENTYIKFHLYKGKELTKKDIKLIKQTDQVERSYSLAIQYLSYRMRTKQEIRTYLLERDYSPYVIDQTIERLKQEQLIDDFNFATMFVRDRIRRSNKGPLMIKKELETKGIANTYINKALQQYSKEKQFEKAFQHVEKALEKRSNHSFKNRKIQIKQQLQRRGYSSELIYDVFNQIDFERDEAHELKLLEKLGIRLYNRYKDKYDTKRELSLRLKQRLYSRGFDLDAIDQFLFKLLNDE